MALPAEFVPQELTYEVEPGKTAPIAEHPFYKETPDLATFHKRVMDTHRELGSRVPIKIERVRNSDGTFGPKVEQIEQWRKDHLPKLYDAGILDRPPSKPEEYEIKKPDNLIEGVNWSPDRASKFASIGIKYGVPKAAMAELHALHVEGVQGTQEALNTSYDATILDLKREHGDKYEERLEMAKRFNNLIFKTPEEIAFMERTGIGNHPVLTGILMRLAPYAQNDSSLVEALKQEGSAAGTQTPAQLDAAREAIRNEIADIANNPANPRHAAYNRQDPEVEKYINDKYAALYGTGKVAIEANSGVQIVRGGA